MKKPIKYTIENTNGIQTVSDSFDVNDNVFCIRIITVYPIIEYARNSPVFIINEFSINGIEVRYKNFFDSSGFCSTVLDISITEFIKNTNDLDIKIIENSKIEVVLFLEEPKNEFRGFELPEIIFNK